MISHFCYFSGEAKNCLHPQFYEFGNDYKIENVDKDILDDVMQIPLQ